MKRLGCVALALTSALLALAAPASASSQRAFYLGDGPRTSQVGIRVEGDSVTAAFVRYRVNCHTWLDSREYREITVLARPVPIVGGGFEAVHEGNWNDLTTRILLRADLGRRAEGLFRSLSHEDTHPGIEKCRSGQLRFSIAQTGRHRFEAAYRRITGAPNATD